MNSWQYRYDTGWLLNEIGGAGVADWTNVHLGSNPTTDSNVTHNLNAPLSDLLVKVFISTDGTDATSFEVEGVQGDNASASALSRGYSIHQVDLNNIRVQTGLHGMDYILDATGVQSTIDNENWYYKIKIWFLG